MAINTKDGKTATVAKHQFLSVADALYCENCFFYAGATLNVNINVCGIFYSYSGGYTYFYDANLPTAVQTDLFGYYYSTSCNSKVGCVGVASDAAARAKTDCGTLTGVAVPNIFNCENLQCDVGF